MIAMCKANCGRPARARGLCGVCFEYERRKALGLRTPSYDLRLLKSAARDVTELFYEGIDIAPAVAKLQAVLDYCGTGRRLEDSWCTPENRCKVCRREGIR
jgi:hypothetical protein